MTERSDKLAIEGGTAARSEPWPPRRLFGEEEKQAVADLFDEAIAAGGVFGYNGEQETEYGKEFAEFLGGGFCDPVNSGTNAVYVALRSLDLEPFTEVIVPPITDPGGVMPVPLLNCIPVPADTAPDSYNMGPEQIEARLTERTSAILVAHITGLPCDMDPIMELARARGIPVVEDCAQSHGALYKGRMTGTIGDVAAFSTMSGKHHASGGQGGLVFAKDQARYWRIRQAADRGKPFGVENPRGNVMASLNFNMDDMHAAVGRVQLRKLPGILARRRAAATALARGCRERLSCVRMTEPLPGCEGAYWFLFAKLDLDAIRVDKSQFVAALAAEGISAGASYYHAAEDADWYTNRVVFGTSGYPWACPLYKGDPNQTYPIPNARATDDSHINLRLHEDCGEQEVADVLAGLAKVEAAYRK